MGAMTKLSLANNMLATKSNAKGAGEALGDMLKGNLVLKELDVSGNAPFSYTTDGVSFAVGISQGLSDNGTLTSLNLASNCLCGIDEDGTGWYDASSTACSVSCLV
jgi:hypothetical protein